MLFLALISVVAAYSGKYKERAQCYPSGEPGDRVFDPTAFEDKEHASREAAMTECAEACDKDDNCHFAEFSRNSNNNLASCELWGSDCWEESLDDVWASEPAVYVKSGDLENWKKYDDSETALPAKGALGSLCYVAGDDPTLGDKNCNDGLLCAKKGYDNRDFGGCKSHGVVGPPFNQHCCSTPPAVQADGSSGSGASGSEDEASSAGSEDGSANNDAGKADGSSGSVASAEWNLIADGTKGEAGCSVPEYAIAETHGNIPLEDCKGKCQNFSFMNHHANNYCSCLSACSLTRPAGDFSSKALVYERQALTAWPEHGGCENCRCGGSTNDSPAESQGACEARAQGSGHDYYSYTANNGYCLTVAACDDIVTGTGWPWKIFKKPADVCTANHDARPGSTSSERCLALSGCCYNGDTDHCGTCTAIDRGDYVFVRHRDDSSCACLPKDDPCLNQDVCFADATCDDEDYVVVRHKDDSSCECTPAHDPCLNDGVCNEDPTCTASDYNDGFGKWKYASIKSLETLREWCKLSWDNCFACGGRWKGSTELGFCRKGRLQNKRLSKCKSFFRDWELCVHLGCNAITRKKSGKTVCKNHLSSSGVSFDHLE